MPIRLFAPRYWPTWFGLGLLWLVSQLPYRWLLALGRPLGRLLRRLPLRFAAVARRNIELCLPALSSAEREEILERHFESLGIALLEVGFTWWSSLARWEPLIRIEGRENLAAALRRGKGAILLAAHFTTLEVGGRMLLSLGPTGFLYRPTRNAVVAHFLKHRRCKYGGQPIPRDDIRSMIAILKRNGCVWYAPDQSYRKKGAEMVPLFGIPAATNTSTSRIARMTGAAVLPYFFERLPGGCGYRAHIGPALEQFPSDDSVADALRFNHLLEAAVRRNPEQYLWIHRRFKGLTPDYPDYYKQARTSRSA